MKLSFGLSLPKKSFSMMKIEIRHMNYLHNENTKGDLSLGEDLYNKKREVNNPVSNLESDIKNLNETSKNEKIEEQDAVHAKSNADVEALELEKKRKVYWSEDTEEAVVEFLNNDCNYFQVKLEKYFDECKKKKINPDFEYVEHLQEKYEWASGRDIIHKKELIYKKRIHKPLNRLIENIIFNFKLFRPGVDIKTIQADCLSFVYGKFANFNPDKNAKSFSFFGTIAKHYLMGEKKDIDKSQQINLDYDNHREEVDGKDVTEIGEKSDLDTSFSLFSFIINSLESEIEKKLNNPDEKKTLSDNDLKVADAIVQIFKSHELLGAYNKNHVYHLIKEYTGLQTKDITYSLARFRVFYRLLKQDFIRDIQEED
jgi:hypothetical protein